MNYGMGGLISAHVDSFGEQSDDVTSEHIKVLFSKIKRFRTFRSNVEKLALPYSKVSIKSRFLLRVQGCGILE